jgi:hypothetical protein
MDFKGDKNPKHAFLKRESLSCIGRFYSIKIPEE